MTHPVLILCAILVSYLPISADAHGRMLAPPSRMSAYLLGFNTPVNYLDHQMNCGGRVVQWQENNGKCGICGDPWSGPRDYERPDGQMVQNLVITETYKENAVITIKLQITANHRGWSEFRLCDVRKSGGVEATHKCLDENLLQDENGQTRFYFKTDRTGFYDFTLVLPEGLTCPQCVLQWKWKCGNDWGCDSTGCGVGYGEVQEEFYACADISIKSRTGGNTGYTTRRPTVRTTPRTTYRTTPRTTYRTTPRTSWRTTPRTTRRTTPRTSWRTTPRTSWRTSTTTRPMNTFRTTRVPYWTRRPTIRYTTPKTTTGGGYNSNNLGGHNSFLEYMQSHFSQNNNNLNNPNYMTYNKNNNNNNNNNIYTTKPNTSVIRNNDEYLKMILGLSNNYRNNNSDQVPRIKSQPTPSDLNNIDQNAKDRLCASCSFKCRFDQCYSQCPEVCPAGSSPTRK